MVGRGGECRDGRRLVFRLRRGAVSVFYDNWGVCMALFPRATVHVTVLCDGFQMRKR